MINLFSKDFEPGELVLDTCPCTLPAAKVCVQLPEQYRSIVCENYSARFSDALSSVVEVYSKKVLSREREITGRQEIVETRKMFAKKIAVLSSCISVDRWTMRPVLFLCKHFVKQ